MTRPGRGYRGGPLDVDLPLRRPTSAGAAVRSIPLTEVAKLMRIHAPIRKIEMGQRTDLTWWAQELRTDVPNTIVAMGHGSTAIEALRNMKAIPQFEGSVLPPATWIGPVVDREEP